MTREEIEVKRVAVLASRVKWEEKHSGSFEIAFPAPDPVKQALYERILDGARESFEKHGTHSRQGAFPYTGPPLSQQLNLSPVAVVYPL